MRKAIKLLFAVQIVPYNRQSQNQSFYIPLSPINLVTSPFCSFEENCGWKWTPGVWQRKRVVEWNQFMLQGEFHGNTYRV